MNPFITLMILPIYIAYEGFVLSTFWSWFVVPLGAPALGVAQAAGIALMVSVARAKASETKQHIDAAEWAAHAFGTPTFALAVGWVIQLFM